MASNVSKVVWTDDLIESLKKHWLTDLTIVEIAKTMQISRRQVIMMKDKLKLPRRVTPAQTSPFMLTKKATDTTVLSLPHKKKISREKLSSPVTIENLTNEVCKFPISTNLADDNFLFCGHAVIKPPYCELHRSKCYEQATGMRVNFRKINRFKKSL